MTINRHQPNPHGDDRKRGEGNELTQSCALPLPSRPWLPTKLLQIPLQLLAQRRREHKRLHRLPRFPLLDLLLEREILGELRALLGRLERERRQGGRVRMRGGVSMGEGDDGLELEEMAGFDHSVGFVDDEIFDVADGVGDGFVLKTRQREMEEG
jgi:hypothetical protein